MMRRGIQRFAFLSATATGMACMWPLIARPWPCTDNDSPVTERPIKTVIVVGGGVVGISTAFSLSRKGYKVTLLESQSEVASQTSASWGNACLVSHRGFIDLTTLSSLSSIVRPMIESLRCASGTNRDIEGGFIEEDRRHRTGQFFKWQNLLTDPYFYRFASFYVRMLLLRPGDRLRWDRWEDAITAVSVEELWTTARQEKLVEASRLRTDGTLRVHVEPASMVKSSVNSNAEASECVLREPFLAHYLESLGDGSNGDHMQITAREVQASTSGNCSAYCKGLLERSGAEIIFGADVKRLTLSQDGECVRGVELNDGKIITADAVVVCAGWQTPVLLDSVGLYAPIHPMRGYSITADIHSDAKVESIPQAPTVFEPYHLYCSRPSDFSVRMTSYGEFTSMGDVLPTKPLVRRLEELVEHCAPGIINATNWERRQVWCGIRPQTPDSLPIVSATRLRGLYINSGHSSYGWKMATHTSTVLVDVLQGKSSKFSELYSLQRFK